MRGLITSATAYPPPSCVCCIDLPAPALAYRQIVPSRHRLHPAALTGSASRFGRRCRTPARHP
nr:MAG TPA: hypothetical protein [Bacteriophage sp.]